METREEVEEFAERWADAWNRRDVEAVLESFDDDIVFVSPKALEVVGVPAVRGKGALRAYWTAALARVTSLHFTINRIVWDPVEREVAIVYTSKVDGAEKHVSENFRFGDSGLIVSAEVFHGVAVPTIH